jgi:hypothetical protein
MATLPADDAALAEPAQFPLHDRWGCADQPSKLVLDKLSMISIRLGGPTVAVHESATGVVLR